MLVQSAAQCTPSVIDGNILSLAEQMTSVGVVTFFSTSSDKSPCLNRFDLKLAAAAGAKNGPEAGANAGLEPRRRDDGGSGCQFCGTPQRHYD